MASLFDRIHCRSGPSPRRSARNQPSVRGSLLFSRIIAAAAAIWHICRISKRWSVSSLWSSFVESPRAVHGELGFPNPFDRPTLNGFSPAESYRLIVTDSADMQFELQL